MDSFLYPYDVTSPVFAQPPGHWKRRGACDSMVALASVPVGQPERFLTLDDKRLAGDLEGYNAWHYWAHGPTPEMDFVRLTKKLPKGLELLSAKNGEHPTHRLLVRGADKAFSGWAKKFGLNGETTEMDDTHWHMLAWHGGSGRIASLSSHLDMATIDHVDRRGLTAMIIAAHRGTRQDLESWLLLGAHPDIKDRAGNTLLHHVARYGDADWFGRILDLGADEDIKNDRGQRARDILDDRVRHATVQDFEALRRHWEIVYFQKTYF